MYGARSNAALRSLFRTDNALEGGNAGFDCRSGEEIKCHACLGESDTEPGFNVGGGVEYFTSRTVSIKGEGRYHAIGKVRTGQDPSGFVFTGGLKKYW